MRQVVFWLCVLAAVGASTSKNGNEVTDVYAILNGEAPVCAGVPVAQSDKNVVILTAAHCVYGVSNSQLSAKLVNNDQGNPVNQVTVHPYYKPPSFDYDVALLKAGKSATIDVVSPLWTLSKDPLGSAAIVSALSWKEVGTPPKEVPAELVERKCCRTKLANYLTVSSRMICASIQSDVMPGGPLFSQKNIHGIGSYFVKGDKVGLPKVFTNVANSEIYSFIERYIYAQ